MSECAYSPCSKSWVICRCCYRGQKYCSDTCSRRARQEKKREYNRRHQQGAGREAHVECQRAYRLHRAEGGPCVPKDVTDQSSLEPSFDGKLFAASEFAVQFLAHAAGAIQDGSASCHRCGRQSVLVEPLSERRRIVALLKQRTTSHPHRGRRDAGCFSEYVKAIRDMYVGMPTTSHRLHHKEVELARHLYRQRVPLLHVEAALLVESARRVLPHEPHPRKPIRSLHEIVSILEQSRRSALSEGYVLYLRHKLRQVFEQKTDVSVRPRTPTHSHTPPRR